MQASNSSLSAGAASASPFARVPLPVLLIFLGCAALGLLSANPLLTAASILLVPALIALLWRPGEPPVLLFAVGYQWTQVTAKVFHANVHGVPVTAMSEVVILESTIALSLVGLLVLAVGMRLGLQLLGLQSRERIEAELARLSLGRLFVFYLIVTVGARFLSGFAWSVPGLTQPIMALAALRWVAFFLLAYVVFKRRTGYAFFAIAFLIEFVGGLGFFSGFKTVIFVSLIVAFTVYDRIDAKTVLVSIVGVVVLLFVGSVWTIIKSDFRAFVNQERSDGQRVSRSDQLDKMATLIVELRWEDVVGGTEPLFRRLAYVDYFGYTMEYVPAVRPHEEGAVWGHALRHVFQPRMFFPDKPRLLSDSEHTMAYTGLYMASDAGGTSISIGYMGDSYIDYGRWGMFIPIFILGTLWGLMYVFFITKAQVGIIGFAVAVAVLRDAYLFEVPAVKLIGSMLMSFLVFVLLLKFFELKLWRALTSDAAVTSSSQANRTTPDFQPPTAYAR